MAPAVARAHGLLPLCAPRGAEPSRSRAGPQGPHGLLGRGAHQRALHLPSSVPFCYKWESCLEQNKGGVWGRELGLGAVRSFAFARGPSAFESRGQSGDSPELAVGQVPVISLPSVHQMQPRMSSCYLLCF